MRAILLRGQQALLDLGQPDRGRATLVLGLQTLGVEHGGLAHQPGPLVLGRREIVADRDQVLLRAVDLLFQRARLGGGDVGRGGVLLRAPPEPGQRPLEDLEAGLHLLDLAPRRQQALHRAAAFDHRAAQRLPGQRHAGDRAPPRHDLERLLEGLHDQRVGQRPADRVRVWPAHPEQIGDQPARAGLHPRDVAQRCALVARPRRRQGQERAAPGPRLLQPRDPAQGVGRVRHHHRLQAVPEQGLHRALELRIGLDRVGHDAEDLDPVGTGQKRPDAFVERGVRGHDLLERREPAGQAVPLALRGVGLSSQGLRGLARLAGPRQGIRALPGQARDERVGLFLAALRTVAQLGHAQVLALQLLGLGGQLQEVGGRALGVARHRLARVLQRGHPREHGELRLPRRLQLRLRPRLRGGDLVDGGLGGARLFARCLELAPQPRLLGLTGGQVLAQRADPRLELARLAARLGGAGLGLRDLLLAVPAAALVAVHGEGQLVEARADVLQAAPRPREARCGGPPSALLPTRGRWSPTARARPPRRCAG